MLSHFHLIAPTHMAPVGVFFQYAWVSQKLAKVRKWGMTVLFMRRANLRLENLSRKFTEVRRKKVSSTRLLDNTI
jgi:hypothetical protein